MLLVVFLSFSHAKDLLMKFSLESLQIIANQKCGLIVASQLYPYSVCQPIPTGLCTRWDLHPQTSRFTPRQNKTRSLENVVMFCFQRGGSDRKIESFYTTGRQKKGNFVSVGGSCFQCNTMFEAINCFYHFSPCREVRQSITEDDIQLVLKSDSSMNWDQAMYEKEVSVFLNCGSVIGGNSTRQSIVSKNISKKTCLTGVHLPFSNS